MLQDLTLRSASSSLPSHENVPDTSPSGDLNDLQLSKEASRLPKEAISMYLKEIASVPLLTREEEIILAKRIRIGDQEAREQMIKANLRLVVKIAHDYEGLGLPLLDLINEGNIGLMKGVERFDPAYGAKLSTYGSWWIKQSIKRALANQTKTIRLPVHMVDKIFRLRRTEASMTEEFGREPTLEELADELETTPKEIERMRRVSAAPLSLDAGMGDEPDSAHFHDILADLDSPTPSEELRTKESHAILRTYLQDLDPRERQILVKRFGLDHSDPQTLEEVGEEFGITRERVRQIQNKALRKLADFLRQVNGEDPLYERKVRGSLSDARQSTREECSEDI